MNDLLEALTILAKYGNPAYPTHCEHDTLTICINPDLVHDVDKARLEELGVFPGSGEDADAFISFRFGRA